MNSESSWQLKKTLTAISGFCTKYFSPEFETASQFDDEDTGDAGLKVNEENGEVTFIWIRGYGIMGLESESGIEMKIADEVIDNLKTISSERQEEQPQAGEDPFMRVAEKMEDAMEMKKINQNL